ncbi:GNAT family N-acetyltransferase [Photobacterium sp. 1_MG-2023]|uniref:GNAT family N-acetyltransferase n=1 Tax=Photobacterium sp. 1_MG-2023 TaxID=3062646 RepID=UPI0026E3D367|nr:GNAT family N-acetyltransferase [Photobacterium sp. 1_MG-2023]MDO6708682.1 GNAT family N-acetyltransferase [Photobacterium sp. 1_MG-2023]
MNSTAFTIRPMRRDEVEIALTWAAQEGWNPGQHDALCYAAADPDGFLIGLLGDEPIATISAVRYDETFGFIGFYIVKPEYRGMGYGIQIWNAALAYLKGCNIGLDGVVEQQANYQKSGFQLAYSHLRYEGRGYGPAEPDEAIVPLSTLPFETLVAYEQPFFPAPRVAFLEAWTRQPNTTALGILAQGQLAGYGVIRPCLDGNKIGPLYAESAELGERLFLALASQATVTEAVFLDVPEVNSAAVALAEKYGMTVSFGTARMYTQFEPELPLDRIFGVTSFEIG